MRKASREKHLLRGLFSAVSAVEMSSAPNRGQQLKKQILNRRARREGLFTAKVAKKGRKERQGGKIAVGRWSPVVCCRHCGVGRQRGCIGSVIPYQPKPFSRVCR